MTLSDEDSSIPEPFARGGAITQIRLAVSFLTIIPIPIAHAREYDVATSMRWFPLVGLAMGIGFTLEDYALAFLFGHAIRSTLIVLSMAVLSGAVHLDGLADTADAFGAGRDRERALEIMRDSRIGAFGVIALFFTLALKVLSLSTLTGRPRIAALLLAPVLARWSMVAVSYKLDYLRTAGAGSSMLGSERGRNLAIATVITGAAIAPLGSWKVIAMSATALIATGAIRSFYARWLGGVSGDLIGACGEIVEMLAILTIAS